MGCSGKKRREKLLRPIEKLANDSGRLRKSWLSRLGRLGKLGTLPLTEGSHSSRVLQPNKQRLTLLLNKKRGDRRMRRRSELNMPAERRRQLVFRPWTVKASLSSDDTVRGVRRMCKERRGPRG